MAAPLLAAAPAVAKFIAANGTRAAVRKFGQQAVTKAKNQMTKASSKIDDALTPSKLKQSQGAARRKLRDKQQSRTKARETSDARENPTNPATRISQSQRAKAEKQAAEKAIKRQASRQKTARKKAVTQRKRAIAKGAGAAGVVGAGAAAGRAAKTRSENKMGAASEARRGREPSTTAVGGAKNREQLRQNRLKREREANMAMVKKDRPMPKRPSAISLANAADPKAKRPARPQMPPKTKIDMPPADSRGKVTGKGGRNVGQGAFTRANVTREQLKDSGMTLRQYLNFMDREDKRPPKKALRGGMMKSKMKAKGYKAGGKMPMVKDPKTGKMVPEFAADGKGKMMAGGKVKSKGYAKGGMMKSKGYAKGGAMKSKMAAKKPTKQKVRGAGIARKGVRPAKMR